jgi:beta-ketoacyl-acyl-carrier-protein synthase II
MLVEPPMNPSPQRAVITGVGAVTPLGLSVSALWEGLLAGRSGITRITQFDPRELPCQIAGEVKGFDATAYMEAKEARRMTRVSQLALASAQEALRDSKLGLPLANPQRVALVYGTAIGAIDRLDQEIQTMRQRGYDRINPFSVPAVLPNMPTFHITHLLGALGPNLTLSTSCATGTQTVGEALEMIRRDRADIAFCGGAEGIICDFAMAGFASLRALPIHFNDRPGEASRPFERDREGFVFSEGAATLVVERLEHALQRGAHIYAELLGHASCSDAYHVAIPEPSGEGALRAMRWALKNASIEPEEVDYINAHGTSTEANDAMETLAIKRLFGQRAYSIPISSTKSMIGHALGASGAIEAIVCALSLQTGRIHPTINFVNPDPACDLDYVPNRARSANIHIALSNSFGLGGQNACLVLRKWERP